MNPDCVAKKIKAFTLFVSRDAMNIDGLSEATLEKFIAKGFIHDFGDIFEIAKYRDEIVGMDGFGEKSFDNLKVICRHFEDDLAQIRNAKEEEVGAIDGIGPVIARSLIKYFEDPDNNRRLDHLLRYLHINKEEISKNQTLAGMNFVITGSLEHFSNRGEAKNLIESLGGKVTGSVTGKTNYLINNDTASNSSKNKKARELGIPILSETDFLKMTEE